MIPRFDVTSGSLKCLADLFENFNHIRLDKPILSQSFNLGLNGATRFERLFTFRMSQLYDLPGAIDVSWAKTISQVQATLPVSWCSRSSH